MLLPEAVAVVVEVAAEGAVVEAVAVEAVVVVAKCYTTLAAQAK